MTMKIRELKLFVLLLGFLSGNLFGTLLGYLRRFLVWDGLIILTLILLSEVISYMSYKPSTNSRFVTRVITNPRYAIFLWLCKSKISKDFQNKDFQKEVNLTVAYPEFTVPSANQRFEGGKTRTVISGRYANDKSSDYNLFIAFALLCFANLRFAYTICTSRLFERRFGRKVKRQQKALKSFCQCQSLRGTGKKVGIFKYHTYWRSSINFFKIGAMIGFFVDAFKVGS